MPNISLIMGKSGYVSKMGFTVPLQNKIISSMKGTNPLISKENIFYKQVMHPNMGRIGIYAFPEGISESELPKLLDQAEKTIILPEIHMNPSYILGQRSPVYSLDPFQIQLGSTSSRKIDGWQFKGFLCKLFGAEKTTYPIIEKYEGLGIPGSQRSYYFDGTYKTSEPYSRPYAALIFDKAVFEAFYGRELSKNIPNATPPFGFCEFEDKQFNGKRLGFSINFIENILRNRTPEFIKMVLHDVQDAKLRIKTLREAFMAMGFVLFLLHSKGFSHGYSHAENFSFVFDSNNPNNFDPESCRLHDFDSVSFIEDIGIKGFFGCVLKDLSEFCLVPTMARESSGKFSQPMTDKEICLAAKDRGVSPEAYRRGLERDMEITGAFDHPPVRSAEPVINFFKTYFYGISNYISEIIKSHHFIGLEFDNALMSLETNIISNNPFEFAFKKLPNLLTSSDKVPLLALKQLLQFHELPKIEYGISKKIGRNDPCSCGSGRKYKKCCGKEDR